MTLLGLAGLLLASLLGPLLAVPQRARVPVLVGELFVGVIIGKSGFGWAHPQDSLFTFLAQAGFALVMMVAGTHVPVRDRALRRALGRGAATAAGIGVLAVPVAIGLSRIAGTGHAALYAVVIASSSAALVMPVVDEDRLAGPRVLTMTAQVAVADTACIVLLPLAAEPSKAGRTGVGALAVIACAFVLFLVLRELQRRGLLLKIHNESVKRTFGLEMRLSLVLLFALAGLAQNVHVSVLLAGFSVGLALAAIGEPRRLGSQLFAITEGFLGPIFFVWLGASLDLRALVHHPKLIVLGFGLAVGALVVHGLARLVGQPLPLSLLAAAQLGVPVSAVTIGNANGTLKPGEGGAILVGALITIAVAAVSGAITARAAQAALATSMPAVATPGHVSVTPSATAPVTAAPIPSPLSKPGGPITPRPPVVQSNVRVQPVRPPESR
jgi:Kef-type K+ transport system membrane component KefB